jgi:tetratricopeptide (TPR) repeat protein
MEPQTSTGYSFRDVASMVGLPPAEIDRCVRDGVLDAVGEGEQARFSFQDLVLLRKAAGLIAARVPPRMVRRTLVALRRQLPPGRPLSSVQLVPLNGQLWARDGALTWNPQSNQTVFDLFPELPAPVAPVTLPRRLPEEEGMSAEGWFKQGCQLEEAASSAAAMQAYRTAIRLDPSHADAHVNLGRLLHTDGKLPEAEDCFRRALDLRPQDAVAAFNLAVAIDDQSRTHDAVVAYQKALELDPRCADAYFNIARLYERLGQKMAALRALKSYRSLERER